MDMSSKAVLNLIYKYSNVQMPVDTLKLIIRPLLALVIIFPLSLLRNTKQLGMISPFSVVAITLTILSVFVYFLLSFSHGNSVCSFKDQKITSDFRLFNYDLGALQILYFLKYIPTLQFTFNISTSLPIVFQELKGPLQIRRKIFKVSTGIAFAFSLAMYSVISFSTSFSFGKLTTDNVMNTFNGCGFIWMDVISVVYAAVLLLAYPLVLQPPRITFLNLIKKQNSKAWFYLTGVFYIVVSCLMACVLEQIVAIFGLFSALCGFFLYFLVPAACFYQLPKLKRNSKIPSIQSQLKKGEHVDNLAIALLNMISTGSLTDKARKFYAKKTERSQSIEAVRKQTVLQKPQKRSSSLINNKSIESVNSWQFQKVEEDVQVDQKMLQKFDYSKEYVGVNKKTRLCAAISILVCAGVGCGTALVLNLMDFFK